MTRVQAALATLTLLLTADAIFPLLGDRSTLGLAAQPGGNDGDIVKQLVFLALYGWWTAMLVVRFGTFGTWRLARLAWIVVAIAAASVLWSVDPALSARRAVAFAGTTAFGIYLGAMWQPRSIVRLFVVTGIIAALASAAVALTLPDLGARFDGRGVAWNGVFGHKNELGRFMAWTTFAAAVLAAGRARSTDRWLAGAAVLAAAPLLLMSASRTALVVALAMLAIPALLVLAASFGRRGAPALASAVTLGLATATLLGGIAAANWTTVTGALGRDATLTGRTFIWSAVNDAIGDRPLFGYGYSAFWGGPSSPAHEVWERTGRVLDGLRVTHAHNGFLDVILEIGLVGVAAFVVLLVSLLAWSWRRVLGSPMQAGSLLPFGMLMFVLAYNTIESRSIQHNSFMWVGVCMVASMRGIATVASVTPPAPHTAPTRPPTGTPSVTPSTS